MSDIEQPNEVEITSDGNTSPSVVSLAEMEAAAPSGKGKLDGVLAFLASHSWWAIGAIALLFILFLFLPPISLASRLTSGGGFTALTADEPSITHPDGLTVTRASDEAKLQVKLASVPRADFVAEKASKELRPAVEAIPSYLDAKSPYYIIETKGKVQGPASLTVQIPNESEPWETLDLYTWDGKAWHWLPTRLDRQNEMLVADVAALPASVMVMQSKLVQQKVVAEVTAYPVAGAEQVLTEADVPGMLIGTLGGLTGDATKLPAVNPNLKPAPVPVVRNWVAGHDPNWALVTDMLGADTSRQTHIENLVGLAQSGGYGGLVLDYRNLPESAREAYAEFIAALGAAFHEKGLWLAVTVDEPQPASDGSWNTGGYDWAKLGAAADQLRITMPVDPAAYVPGGAVEQMLAWATAQVNRYKLMPIYSTLSTDGKTTLSAGEVLGTIGKVRVTTPLTESVTPGTALTFQLGDQAPQVAQDAATHATKVLVGDQIYWLGTAEWLRTRLDLAARYHLGGVVLRDLMAEGNMPGLLDAVASYKAQTEASASVAPSVTWHVTDPQGKTAESNSPLTQPQFAWTAPQVTGTYHIAASLAGVDKGGLDIKVAVPAPVITATKTTTETAHGEGNDEEQTTTSPATSDDTQAQTLAAAFVADVTVPDYTHFDKGASFVKTWKLRNAGTADWPADTKLIFVQGEQMSDASEVQVGAVKPGDEVEISVNMVAPDKDGTFKGVWKLQAGGKDIDQGLVTVVIKAGEEAQAPPPAPAPAPAPTGGFELGGHVRDLGLPYADKMHYAGMNWMKVQVRYNEDAAGIIAAAHAHNFKVQLSALGSAGMVVQPGFEANYANWVGTLAKEGADAIEVWNEPNIDREWQIGHISPQAYTSLLCKAYQAIKQNNGGTAVISAAPAPTGYFGGCGPNGCDDQPWLEGMYAAGAANCMDYLGAHHNAGATSPSATSGHPADAGDHHHSWYFLPQTQLYYNIFHQTRQLFYTEMGYASQEGVATFSDQFAWARGINNAEQAAWLAEAARLGQSTGMVRCIIVWNIDFVRAGYDPQDGYAIIRPGGGCPACESLHAVMGSR